MASTKDYLETSIWYKEPIDDPYQVLAEFFSSAGLTDYKKCIIAALKAATGNHIWRKINPGDLIYDFKMIESVINAAYLINIERKKSPIVVNKESSFNPNLFCGWHVSDTPWDYFPRVLSFKEFANPYLSIKRFFNYLSIKKWKQELSDVLDYALVKMSMSEAGIDKDVLSIYFHLTKLIEAAHLIDVRENTHVGGIIKYRGR